MPLTKFYNIYAELGLKTLFFIKNDEVFFINKHKKIQASCYILDIFIKKHTEPVLEAETPEEAMDIYMLLEK